MSDTQVDPVSSPLAGSPKHLGRLSVQKSPSQVRMVANTGIVQRPCSQSEPPDRPFRPSGECKTSAVRVPLSLPNSDGNRRSDSRLESVGEDIPIPSSRPNTSLSQQTQEIPRPRHRHIPTTAFRSLVARLSASRPTTRPRLRRRTTRPRKLGRRSRDDILSLSRIQFLSTYFSEHFGAVVAESLIQTHRGSKRSQYEHCWKKFQEWLTANPDRLITKASVLLYLTNLANIHKLSPKTILVHRNALASPLLNGFSINTSDQEFSMLARAQFNQNPPPKRIVPSWNPNKVLSMFEQPRYKNSRSTPGRLLSKTLFLVALASGNRVSELAAFSRSGTNILPGSKVARIAVSPGLLYKNESATRAPDAIMIRSLLTPDGSPHTLCPVDALRHWLLLSDPWGEDAIFVHNISKKKLNRARISQLLVAAINQAQPNTRARAHDVRKYSASLAWARGISPAEIMRTMFWKSTSIFIKKYLVPLKP